MTENALFMRRKYLGPECFKKNLDPKKFQVPKKFGSQEVSGPEKLWVLKNF